MSLSISKVSTLADSDLPLSWWHQLQQPLHTPPSYDNTIQPSYFILHLVWIGNISYRLNPQDTAYIRLRVVSRISGKVLNYVYKSEVMKLGNFTSKTKLDTSQGFVFYVATHSSKVQPLTLLFETELLVERVDGQMTGEILGWFQVDPTLASSVKNCLVVPCRGCLASFLKNQREQKDLSLFSVEMQVSHSKDFERCSVLVQKQMVIGTNDFIPGLPDGRLPVGPSSFDFDELHSLIFKNIELVVPEKLISETQTQLRTLLTKFYKEVQSIRSDFCLKVSVHNGRAIVSNYQSVLERPIKMTDGVEFNKYRIPEFDLLNVPLNSHSILIIELLIQNEIHYQIDANPQAIIKTFSLCASIFQADIDLDQTIDCSLRFNLIHTTPPLRVPEHSIKPPTFRGNLLLRLQRQRPEEEFESIDVPSAKQKHPTRVKLSSTPALIPAIKETEEFFIEKIEISRRQRQMKAQTIRQLEEQLRQIQKENPSLSSKIRIYFSENQQLPIEEEQDNETGANFMSTSFLKASIFNEQDLAKSKTKKIPFCQGLLAQPFTYEGPESPLAGSELTIIPIKLISEKIVPPLISLIVKVFSSERGRTEWLEVDEQGQIKAKHGKEVGIKFKMEQHVQQFKEYLKSRVLQVTVLEAGSFSEYGFCTIPLKNLIRRRRPQVTQTIDAKLFSSQDFKRVGMLKLTLSNKKLDLFRAQPQPRIRVHNYTNMLKESKIKIMQGKASLPSHRQPVEEMDAAERMQYRINNIKIERLSRQLKEQAKPELSLLKEVNEMNKQRHVVHAFKQLELDRLSLTAILGQQVFTPFEFFNQYKESTTFMFLVEDPSLNADCEPQLKLKDAEQITPYSYKKTIPPGTVQPIGLNFLTLRKQAFEREISIKISTGTTFIGFITVKAQTLLSLIDLKLTFFIGEDEHFDKVLPVLSTPQGSAKGGVEIISDQSSVSLHWQSYWEARVFNLMKDKTQTQFMLFYYQKDRRDKLFGVWEIQIKRIPLVEIQMVKGKTKIVGLMVPEYLYQDAMVLGCSQPWVAVRHADRQKWRKGVGQVQVLGEQQGECMVSGISSNSSQVICRWLLRVRLIDKQ